MSEFLEILSPNALKELQALNAEIVKTIAGIKDVNANMISVKTPSGSDSAIKKLTADYDAQRVTIQKLQQQLNSLAVTQTKVTSSAISQRNATRENAVAQQILRAETDRQVRANTLLGGAYAKASAQLLILKKQAKDYAIALGEAHPKTLQAVKDANDLGGRIMSADKVVGDFQRNVGNYSNGLVSGFQKIFSSVRQLAYILPGIGIAGIFGLALDPLFSYIKGLKIVQDTFGLETEAIIKAKEALAEKARVEDDARGKLASYQSDEISRSKLLFENAKNLELPYKKRLEAVTELQTRYPEYLGNLSKEQILAGNTAIAEQQLNDALVKRGIALASQQLIQEEINNGLKNEKWLSDKLNEVQNQRLDLGSKISKIDPFTRDEDQRARYEDLVLQLERITYLESTLKDQYTSKNTKIQESIKFYLEQYNANSKYLDIVHEETKGTKENNKAKKEATEYDLTSLMALENTIAKLKESQRTVGVSTTAYSLLGTQIKLLETIYKGLTESAKEANDAVEGILIKDEDIYTEYFAWLKLKDATDEYLKTITSDSFNKAFENIGLSSAKMFLDFDKNGQSTFDKLLEGADSFKERFAITFQAVGDLAQDVFNQMANLQKQQTEIQLTELEKQKEVALLFAGDSASAKEEIEAQYNSRRKKIQREQAEQQKKLAVFNILINTAQGVVSALASTPPNVPLSIAIGVIGALQAGIVSAQQIPQFAVGTENAPSGLAWTQEKGREIITDKNGNIKSTGSDKGASLTMLSKGDKVYTAQQTALMFDNNLNNMLLGNGISMPKIDVSLSTQAIENKLDNLTNVIANKEGLTIIDDERGRRKFLRKQNETKELLNNVLTYKSIDV